MIYKHLFAITNGTKQGCVIASVLFLFVLGVVAPFIFSIMLLYAFSELDTYVQFGNRTTDRLFDHQRFKTVARLIITLGTVDDAVILSTSQEVLVKHSASP